MNNNTKTPTLFDFMEQSDTLDDVDTAPTGPLTAKQHSRADYIRKALTDYFERNGCGRKRTMNRK